MKWVEEAGGGLRRPKESGTTAVAGRGTCAERGKWVRDGETGCTPRGLLGATGGYHVLESTPARHTPRLFEVDQAAAKPDSASGRLWDGRGAWEVADRQWKLAPTPAAASGDRGVSLTRIAPGTSHPEAVVG